MVERQPSLKNTRIDMPPLANAYLTSEMKERLILIQLRWMEVEVEGQRQGVIVGYFGKFLSTSEQIGRGAHPGDPINDRINLSYITETL